MVQEGQRGFAERPPEYRGVDIMGLKPGTKVLLSGDITAEVVANPRDGYWVVVRYLSVPADSAQVGKEELALWSDFRTVLEAP